MPTTRSSSAAVETMAAPSSRANGHANGHANGSVSRRTGPASPAGWSHSPSFITLFWMIVSLPLVTWDCGYVLLRPWSMPGGRFHSPIWVPYALYGEVDHMYGLKQFEANNGFTSAQGVLNVVETICYAIYMYLWYTNARPLAGSARAAVSGRAGAAAVLFGFSAAVMTVSKTVLYWLNEYFSAFDNIGHNTAMRLLFLWIIPNGAWLIFPTIMIWTMGNEIIDGLAQAPAAHSKFD